MKIIDGLEIMNGKGGTEKIELKVATCECDHAALVSLSEHMGTATKFNCKNCTNPGSLSECQKYFTFLKEKAIREMGVQSLKKTETIKNKNSWANEISKRVPGWIKL